MRKETFDFDRLLELGRTGIRKTARIAALMSIPQSSLYRWLEEDPEFAATYHATLNAALGQSEEALLRLLWTKALTESDVPAIKLLLQRLNDPETNPTPRNPNLEEPTSPRTSLIIDVHGIDAFLETSTTRFLERRATLKPHTPIQRRTTPNRNLPETTPQEPSPSEPETPPSEPETP